MYLTALLLRSPGQTAEHINGFAFLHENLAIPTTANAVPDLTRVADFENGRCVREELDVKPGGHDVLAYLDVACADDTATDAISRALSLLAESVGKSPSPWTVVSDGVVARLGVAIGLEEERRGAAALSELRDRVLRLLRHRRRFGSEPAGAYLVWVRALPGGLELTLPPATRARLPRSVRHVGRFLLPADVATVVPGGTRAALLEGAIALMNRSRNRILADGGMHFVDPETGKSLFSDLPANPSAGGTRPRTRSKTPARGK